MAQSEETKLTEKKESFFATRKPAVIGCLLVIIFIIAIFVAIFVVGTMEATPDDIRNPGP